MKLKLKTLIVAGSLLLANPVWAQIPSDESIKEMLSLMQMEHNLKEMATTMPTLMEALINDTLAEDKQFQSLPKPTQQLMQNVIKRYAKESAVELVSSPALKDALHQSFWEAAKKHYTQNEVNAMNQFLRTPEGSSVMKKQNQFAADFMPNYLKAIAPIQKQIMDKKLAQAQAEVMALLAEYNKNNNKNNNNNSKKTKKLIPKQPNR